MEDYCGLHIPPKSLRTKPRREYIVHNIKEIQQTIFCLRANKSVCCDIACYKCLFQIDNIAMFVSWYRGKKARYRRKRLVRKSKKGE